MMVVAVVVAGVPAAVVVVITITQRQNQVRGHKTRATQAELSSSSA